MTTFPVQAPVVAEEGNDADAVRKVVFLALGAELAVLVLTGVFLVFFYRPTAAQSWDDMRTLHTAVTFGLLVRLVHRYVSYLFIFSAIASAVVLRRERLRGLAAGSGLAVVGLAAYFTGFMLAWDQLALWAVKVGTNMTGMLPLFRSETRFVLIGGVEVGPDTLIRWFWIHVGLGVLAVAVVLLLARLRLRPRVSPRNVDV